MPDDRPVVLLTRPLADSRALAEEIEGEVTLSPILRIDPVGDVGPLPREGGLILTSRHGAARVQPSTLPAYCVGGATKKAAEARGLIAIDGGGSAETLVTRMLVDRPEGHWLHLRGEKARGDIAERLSQGGLSCTDRVVYRQQPQPLNSKARALLLSGQRVILPLFSPFSAQLVAAEMPENANVTIVAMSDAVAREVEWKLTSEVIVASEPTRSAMLISVKAAIGRGSRP